jgi:serine/threonine protein kinase
MSESPESPGEAPPPVVVPEHELVRLIGTGAGGDVWLAKSALGTHRAVKIVYRKSFSWAKAYEDEFHGLLKFEPLSRQHDGLVDVLQVGGNAAAGYFYYVMELADDVRTGPNIDPEKYVPRTLQHDLADRRRLPVGECVRLGAAIASALHFLHRQQLIHRDVKPANIVFVNGFPKLADAGLVTEMFKTSSWVGTEGFIAPEGPGTARADIFSLGKVLYQISTGKRPNEYPELPAEMGKPAEERDLVQFSKIILKACRTNPLLRYKDADEMMGDLTAFQFHTPMPFESKNIKLYAGWIGIAALLVAIVVVMALLWHFFQFILHPSG